MAATVLSLTPISFWCASIYMYMYVYGWCTRSMYVFMILEIVRHDVIDVTFSEFKVVGTTSITTTESQKPLHKNAFTSTSDYEMFISPKYGVTLGACILVILLCVIIIGKFTIPKLKARYRRRCDTISVRPSTASFHSNSNGGDVSLLPRPLPDVPQQTTSFSVGPNSASTDAMSVVSGSDEEVHQYEPLIVRQQSDVAEVLAADLPSEQRQRDEPSESSRDTMRSNSSDRSVALSGDTHEPNYVPQCNDAPLRSQSSVGTSEPVEKSDGPSDYVSDTRSVSGGFTVQPDRQLLVGGMTQQNPDDAHHQHGSSPPARRTRRTPDGSIAIDLVHGKCCVML